MEKERGQGCSTQYGTSWAVLNFPSFRFVGPSTHGRAQVITCRCCLECGWCCRRGRRHLHGRRRRCVREFDASCGSLRADGGAVATTAPLHTGASGPWRRRLQADAGARTRIIQKPSSYALQRRRSLGKCPSQASKSMVANISKYRFKIFKCIFNNFIFTSIQYLNLLFQHSFHQH